MPDSVMMQGTVKPYGTLELDQPVTLPPGRVQVMVQPMASNSSGQPGVLAVIAEIRRNQQSRGHVSRTKDEIDALIKQLRQEAEEEMQEADRLYQECHQTKEPPTNGPERSQ